MPRSNLHVRARSRAAAALLAALLASGAWYLVRPSEVHAAGEIVFLKPWKIRVKGGGPQVSAKTNDVAGTTTLTFDPGFSTGGGKRTAKLTAKRKFRVTEDATSVQVEQDIRFALADAFALADVSVRRGRDIVLAHPVFREAIPGNAGVFTYNWLRFQELPAGTYTIVISIRYRRSKIGQFGEAAPPQTPHEIKLTVRP